MQFKSLKEKSEYYRSLTDYRLMPNSYMLITCDGRSFSSKIKNYFKLPFDNDFVNIMNETARYTASQIQGALFGYTQSDEFTIVVADFDPKTGEDKSSFFEYRLSKILSIVAATATSKFNQLMYLQKLTRVPTCVSTEDAIDIMKDTIENDDLYEFDCKAWNVPSMHQAYTHLLWRQYDCLRNSKQQFAQTYAKHKELENLNADKQVDYVKEKYGQDWHEIEDGLKFGRMLIHKDVEMHSEDYGDFTRKKWVVHPAWSFGNDPDFVKDALIGEFNL